SGHADRRADTATGAAIAAPTGAAGVLDLRSCREPAGRDRRTGDRAARAARLSRAGARTAGAAVQIQAGIRPVAGRPRLGPARAAARRAAGAARAAGAGRGPAGATKRVDR